MDIAVIGTKDIKKVKCFSWIDFITQNPVIAGEFDLAIYYLPTLDKRALDELNSVTVPNVRKRILEGINTRTTSQIVITSKAETGTVSHATNYSIFPFQLYITHEQGQKILNKPEHSQYYNKVQSWTHTFLQMVKPLEGTQDSLFQWNFSVGTTTGHNKPIGFTIDRVYVSVNKPTYPAMYSRPARKTEKMGSILFIPPQSQNKTSNEVIEDLIADLTKNDNSNSNYPEFLSEIKMQLETDLESQIEDIVQIIDVKKQKLEELNHNLDSYKFKKGILFFDGKQLEDAVAQILNEMGIPYDKNDGNEEDGTIHLDGMDFLVEIKGSSGGVPTTKVLGQLMGRRGNYEETTGNKIGALLIANPYRHKKLTERPKSFEDNLVQTAKLQNIKLLNTQELFKFWNEYLNFGTDLLTKELSSSEPEILFTSSK